MRGGVPGPARGVRAEGAARIDPPALGRVLGLDRAPEVKTIRRKITYLAGAGKAGDWIAAMARRHVDDRPGQAAVLVWTGMCAPIRAPRRIAKTHVPRLKFPAPATLETWVADAAGDPLLVVLAEPGASLASELRRLIPDLRAMVGDERRVLVGFDRGGWSPTLFADLHAAGFDTVTWRKGAIDDIDENQGSPSTPTSMSAAAATPGHWPTPTSSWTSPTGPARARCFRCARSACSTPRTPQLFRLGRSRLSAVGGPVAHDPASSLAVHDLVSHREEFLYIGSRVLMRATAARNMPVDQATATPVSSRTPPNVTKQSANG